MMVDMRGSRAECVDQAQLVDLTRRLVELDTSFPTGNEQGAMCRLADYLAGAGIDSELQEVDDGRPNLIARLPGEDRSGHLVLSCHMDAVPAGKYGWTHDPLGADLVDGRIFGRGAADMKGGVAAMAAAMVTLARGGFQPTADLILAVSMGEERGALGARHMAASGVLSGCGSIVVGEPSAGAIHTVQKGSCTWRVTVRGRAAHSSLPHLGVNAIAFMARVILALEDDPFTFARDPLLGDPTTCVAGITGGTADNMVPDECSIVVGLRLVRGQSWELPEARLRQLLDELTAVRGMPVTTEVQRLKASHAVGTDPGHALVRAMVEAARPPRGTAPSLGGCTAGTDGGVLSPALGAPMVIYGPGDFRQAHGPDEYVEVAQLHDAARAYVRIAERLLGGATEDGE
jgi:succinyl-diaminopimelate desuccinylase